jgi:hypothetical protein
MEVLQYMDSRRWKARTPHRQRHALISRNLIALQKLLDHDFAYVARNEYKWLHELDQVGYSRSDIAALLLEEASDAPWIHFDPQYRPPQEIDAQVPTSLPDSYSSIESLGSPWRSKGYDVKMVVQRLCGIGGIAPVSRAMEAWNGQVFFD